MTKKGEIDKIFLGIVIALLVFGLFSFVSAAFGVLAKNEAKFASILFSQAMGLIIGFILMYGLSRVPYTFWRKHAFYIFVASLVITLLVFTGIGREYNGARRWINIFGVNFQPVEFLKIAFVFYFASWLSWVKSKAKELKYSILPLAVILLIIATILILQPDHKSIGIIVLISGGMLIVSGVPWKYILGAGGISILVFAGMVMFSKDYVKDRVFTFINPGSDLQDKGFQIDQSLFAIGSGELFGRGLGKSVQKFTSLPEPHGDSIFAVIGEEFGFVGGFLLISLYVAFALRGMKIAFNAPDSFSRLLVVGLVILIFVQSFINIASNIGLFPLTGVPLVFVSHGGTSMMISLAIVGIILNVSRKKPGLDL